MIDCDVHCAPDSWEELGSYLSSNWRQFVDSGGIPLSGPAHAYPAEAATSAVPEVRETEGPHVPTTYEHLRQRLLAKTQASIVVLNCLTMFDAIRHPYFQVGLAAGLNDWLRGEFLERDGRLRASLVVPWSNTEGAVAEIERVGDDPRFVQVLLPIRAEAPWGQKAHHPIFAAAAERGLAVALHAWGLQGHAPSVSGFTSTYMEDYLSNATIVQHHLASFVAEGVFERFPTLKVVLLECGFTWLPSMLWRFDKHWKSFWPEVPWVKQKPSSYIHRNVRATTSPAHLGNATQEQIRELVEMIGSDWLMYASDYPHDHGSSGERLLGAVDTSTREAILAGNAAELYALGDEDAI